MEQNFLVNHHNSTANSRASHEIFLITMILQKTNMWQGLLYDHVEGPFIFAENTIKGNIILSILKMSPFPQTELTGKEEVEEEEEEKELLLPSNTK
jgi:hypothetical protein